MNGAAFRDFHLLLGSRFCMSYLPASADNAFLLFDVLKADEQLRACRRMRQRTGG
jgi:hypothetical protein